MKHHVSFYMLTLCKKLDSIFLSGLLDNFALLSGLFLLGRGSGADLSDLSSEGGHILRPLFNHLLLLAFGQGAPDAEDSTVAKAREHHQDESLEDDVGNPVPPDDTL